MRRARVLAAWVGGCGLLAALPAMPAIATATAERPFVAPAAQTAATPAPAPAPAPGQAQAPAPATDAKPATSLDALAWMAGDWTGTAGRAAIEEHWIPAAGKLMMGVSRTLVGDRAVAFEFIRLEQRADGIVYVAQPGGRPPTEFRLTASGASAATFENPQHDHPKIIRYWKDGDATLIAEIEGDEKGKHVKQRFIFTRAPRP